MTLKIEIITRFILTIGLIFVIFKYIGPSLFSFFWSFKNKKQSNTDNDLGYLIRAQEKKITGIKTNKRESSNAASKFHKSIFNQLSKDKTKNGELDKILEFIDNSKWGDGAHFTRLLKELKNKDKFSIDTIHLNKNIKFLLSTDYYYENKGAEPNLNSIMSKTKTFIFLDHIINKIMGNSILELTDISKQLRTTPSSLVSSFYMLTTKDKQQIIFSNILKIQKNPNNISKYFLKLKTKQGVLNFAATSKLKTINEIKSLLKQNIFIIEAITPLPEFNSKSKIELAYVILGVTESASITQVKKAYQTLAKLKHPDMLKSKGIPDSFDKVAHENFTILKNAYDMIKKNK